MTDYDLADLTPLIHQLIFGIIGVDAITVGGLATVVGVDDDHVIEINDPGNRPEGLFLTFSEPIGGGRPLYGSRDQQYLEVEDDPEDEDKLLLLYDNASMVVVTMGIHAPADQYTELALRNLARLAQRHAISVTNPELKLLGLDARITDPGEIRDGTTIINREVERVVKFGLSIVVGEAYTVQVGKFETFTLTHEEGMEDDEGNNPTREERVITP